jgi:hypothetical protein
MQYGYIVLYICSRHKFYKKICSMSFKNMQYGCLYCFKYKFFHFACYFVYILWIHIRRKDWRIPLQPVMKFKDPKLVGRILKRLKTSSKHVWIKLLRIFYIDLVFSFVFFCNFIILCGAIWFFVLLRCSFDS